MDYTKKFILVDPSKVNMNDCSNHNHSKAVDEVVSRNNRLEDSAVTEVYDLDKKMELILNDKSLPPSEKVRLYNETLSRFQDSYKKWMDTPVDVKVVEEAVSEKSNGNDVEATTEKPSSESIHSEFKKEHVGKKSLDFVIRHLPKSMKAKGQIPPS